MMMAGMQAQQLNARSHFKSNCKLAAGQACFSGRTCTMVPMVSAPSTSTTSPVVGLHSRSPRLLSFSAATSSATSTSSSALHRSGTSQRAVHTRSSAITDVQAESSTPGAASTSGLSAGWDVPAVPGHWTDDLSETQRYVLADEWGFDMVGTSLPAGIDPRVIMHAVPEECMQHDFWLALRGLLAPLGLMAAGYGWLAFMHGIIPFWQQLACWLTIGTGYAGLFTLAHECARGAFLPQYPKTQAVLGALLMAPSLYAFDAWRVRTFNHVCQPNVLGEDTESWHPLTIGELRAATPLQRRLLRAFATGPLKLIASIADIGRSMQGWDLRTYYEGLRSSVMGSWVATGLFAGVVLPALVAAGGLGGLVSWWLMPWLVFHAWLSTITLCQHTAPNIPWRRDGPTGGYDRTRSVISGTVTLRMPGWLEALLNYPNYHVPMHLSLDGIPFYHAKKATEAMREKLWPYMSEAHFGPKLITNHVTKWQVYDEETGRYITFDEALGKLGIQEAEQGNGVAGSTQEAADGGASGPTTSPAAA